MDKYFYPIPKADLIVRFKRCFELLERGVSVSLVSIPHSGKSSLIQFLLSQPELLSEIGLTRKIIYLNPENFSLPYTTNLYRQISDQINPDSMVCDEYSLLKMIKAGLKFPVTFVVDWYEGWKNLGLDAGLGMKSIYESGQHHHPCLVNFLFLAPPDMTHFPFFQPLRNNLTENVIDFPLLNPVECKYSIIRFSKMWDVKISPHQIKKIIEGSSGIAGLIKPLIVSPVNQERLDQIYNSLISYVEYLPKNCFVRQSLKNYFPKQTILGIKITGELTAQELNLLEYFTSHQNQIVSRDQISEILWGKLATTKYSDWAIDKAMSRLKNKIINNSKNKILTIKNAGYKMFVL